MNEIIRMLRSMYDEMPNEKILLILKEAERVKALGTEEEERFREQELLQLLGNLKEYPHAVTTWVLGYRDKELE